MLPLSSLLYAPHAISNEAHRGAPMIQVDVSSEQKDECICVWVNGGVHHLCRMNAVCLNTTSMCSCMCATWTRLAAKAAGAGMMTQMLIWGGDRFVCVCTGEGVGLQKQGSYCLQPPPPKYKDLKLIKCLKGWHINRALLFRYISYCWSGVITRDWGNYDSWNTICIFLGTPFAERTVSRIFLN